MFHIDAIGREELEIKAYHLISKSPMGLISYLMAYKCPRIILAYHGIAPNNHSCVDPGLFHDQVVYIKENYTVVSIEEIVNKSTEIDGPLLAITFDDAYVNLLDNALPVLAAYGLPATIFAPVNYLGKKNYWDNGSSASILSIMDKNDLRNLLEKGFEVGSHTKNHIRLKGVSQSLLLDEIGDSKKILEDILGHSVRSFAFPHGGRNDIDKAAIKIVQDSGYAYGLTTSFGRFNSLQYRYELRRIIIWPSDKIDVFSNKLQGYYDWLILKEIIIHYLKSRVYR